jgi:hypothetical protein
MRCCLACVVKCYVAPCDDQPRPIAHNRSVTHTTYCWNSTQQHCNRWVTFTQQDNLQMHTRSVHKVQPSWAEIIIA